ncbi:MAG: hypothetical protein GC146_06415 [Limimaricola sp.]|uniref:hypothetical protein n=1 Tax=Limimaricola sp. TaxID=2211665 RepID=UPI001D3FB24D|nr:hypothetical protein [Limimaricola sp.]MBI1416841.1 hypothetical protein [Limimaricola sp.]
MFIAILWFGDAALPQALKADIASWCRRTGLGDVGMAEIDGPSPTSPDLSVKLEALARDHGLPTPTLFVIGDGATGRITAIPGLPQVDWPYRAGLALVPLPIALWQTDPRLFEAVFVTSVIARLSSSVDVASRLHLNERRLNNAFDQMQGVSVEGVSHALFARHLLGSLRGEAPAPSTGAEPDNDFSVARRNNQALLALERGGRPGVAPEARADAVRAAISHLEEAARIAARIEAPADRQALLRYNLLSARLLLSELVPDEAGPTPQSAAAVRADIVAGFLDGYVAAEAALRLAGPAGAGRAEAEAALRLLADGLPGRSAVLHFRLGNAALDEARAAGRPVPEETLAAFDRAATLLEARFTTATNKAGRYAVLFEHANILLAAATLTDDPARQTRARNAVELIQRRARRNGDQRILTHVQQIAARLDAAAAAAAPS